MNNWPDSLRLCLNSVKVENCVLSRQTRVAEGATLKDCESRPGAEVIAKGAREEQTIYMPRSSDPEGL
jgi:ADP-glucose pyrophosphorylase